MISRTQGGGRQAPLPWTIFCSPYRAKSRYPCGVPTPPASPAEMWDMLSCQGDSFSSLLASRQGNEIDRLLSKNLSQPCHGPSLTKSIHDLKDSRGHCFSCE